MSKDKVLGAYAAVGTLSPNEQAEWYRRIVERWNIRTFEIPILAGNPMVPELARAFADLPASLVVTLVAQWATVGQKRPEYGLASTDDSARDSAVVDAISIVQQCAALSEQGVRIRNIVVHAGQRTGTTISHAIAFYHSLTTLRRIVGSVLPDTTLAVEPADTRDRDHPIAFPASKKCCLGVDSLIQTITAVNQVSDAGHPAGLVMNWGRQLINGDQPLSVIHEILDSEVPLSGVILSGAGASPEGFIDSHNSHLDPDSGFTPEDAIACAAALNQNPQPSFIGMKCSRAKGDAALGVEEVLAAQGELLGNL